MAANFFLFLVHLKTLQRQEIYPCCCKWQILFFYVAVLVMINIPCSNSFHVLAIVNCAAMNTGVHVSFWIKVFVFFRYIHRSGISGSYSSFIFSFLSNLHTDFHSDFTKLHLHQRRGRAPFSPHPLWHLLFVFFFMMTILTGVWGNTSLWFLFACPWWLAMLSIFSCASWASAFLLWRNVYSVLLPSF